MPAWVHDPNRIMNEPLREAVLRAHARGEITYSGLARELGFKRWTQRYDRPNGSASWKADATRLCRILGIKPYKEKNGKTYLSKTILIRDAELIMQHLGLDPIDVGL